MSFRITTGMMMNNYRFNLQGSTKNMDDARNQVITHRKFNSYAEDPASATHAWRLRRAYSKNDSYTINNNDTLARIRIGWETLGTIKTELYDKAATTAELRGSNDPTGDAREPLGKVLHNTAESVVQAMNGAKYGDHFIFAGDDSLNAPFTWNEDKTVLYYRGVNVNAGLVKKPETAAEPDWLENVDTTGMTDEQVQAWKDYYNHVTDVKPSDVDPANVEPNWIPSKQDLQDAQAWADYYNQEPGAPVAKPGTAEPTWVTDGAQKAVADGTMTQAEADAWVAYYGDPENGQKPAGEDPGWVPETVDSETAQGWVDYYNHVTDEKPANPVPDWAKDPKDVDEFGVPNALNNPKFEPANEDEAAWAAYYKDQGDVKRLEKMANEVVNVDLGMGLTENEKGQVVNGTAFNMALPGIAMLGYGVDADGDPKNGVMLMVRLGEILEGYDPETDSFDPPENRAEYDRLINKFRDANDHLIDSYSDVDTKGQFLEANAVTLKDQKDYLAEEVLNLEQVDLADAITEFSWDYYCYSAALKVGTQLLSQSLIDYMS